MRHEHRVLVRLLSIKMYLGYSKWRVLLLVIFHEVGIPNTLPLKLP